MSQSNKPELINAYPSDLDLYLFHQGNHHEAYTFMGAHKSHEYGQDGIRFTTWAPNAGRICVIGDFNSWEISDDSNMSLISTQGIWSVFIPNANQDMKYKFAVFNKNTGHMVYKSDPYAISSELRPGTASIIKIDTDYKWHDEDWLEYRASFNPSKTPINIYEVHLASWKTNDGKFMTYEELSEVLPQYVHEMGYTHVELMPLHEHPLDKSWGYQAVGYYSATSRHGDLRGLKKLIDIFHQHNIGVILDWVAGHFCKDSHGLINFDGSPTYEYQDYNKANNKGWGAHNFDLGRNEVKSFLISNALYWLREFHFDGLRVDAVSNIIYLNYDRNDGEWSPNSHGGNENLEGTGFLREFNWTVHECLNGIITIAEESSAWPNITGSVHRDGLGFDFKWNMGWMNDTLRYIELDTIYRKYHHNLVNFSMAYHYSENFVLSLSHDEVVHGKKSLVDKMHGDLWQKYAGYRAYITYMMGHPGKKLMFMGNEFAQFIEWREYEELQWNIINEYPIHKQIQDFFKAANNLYSSHSSLWELDYSHDGFKWIDANNNEQSILSFTRYNSNGETLVFICNFTSEMHLNYKIGIHDIGSYEEIFNSDNINFGGSGQIMKERLFSMSGNIHECTQYLEVKIPPLASIVLKKID
ncbi:MAG: 1,4-alpha-glucan branching protein GlgB [Burkholderiales bacterium]|nr:1,4-alpha-glucan branching protein GlgB [Burkholderiales bacterium]